MASAHQEVQALRNSDRRLPASRTSYMLNPLRVCHLASCVLLHAPVDSMVTSLYFQIRSRNQYGQIRAVRLFFAVPIAMFWIALAYRGERDDKGPPLQKSASFWLLCHEYLLHLRPTRKTRISILTQKVRLSAAGDAERRKIDNRDSLRRRPRRQTGHDGPRYNRRGQPDLVISEWLGGANCCLTLHIFEIGPTFRKIADIDAEFGY